MKIKVKFWGLFIILYGLFTWIWKYLKIDAFIARLPSEIGTLVNTFFNPVVILSILISSLLYLLWKVPGMNRIVQFFFDTNPCIEGTWKGTLYYQWEGKNQEKPIYLSISQKNAYKVQCNLYTELRTSYSELAFFDKSKNITRLIYTYGAEKAIYDSENNPQHNGITILTLGENRKTLEGEYFTNHKTTGRIELEFLSRKTVCSFKDAESLFANIERK